MADIHFGTDGWRAIIGEDFTEDNVARVVEAAAHVFAQQALQACRDENCGGNSAEKGAGERAEERAAKPVLIIGYDCRLNARAYAELAAQVAAAQGFRVKLSQAYCPTPTLCWAVAHDEDAFGGIMLTSSHNPAEYLGIKLRMADGGASPKEFTDLVEAALPQQPTSARGIYEDADLMTAYLSALKSCVDIEAIRAAHLRVVVDPLFGAGRGYLAGLLREVGVEVVEINNAEDPTFDGLHPEPILPWVSRSLAKVKELGYDAAFINDGDADRIGAGDEHGNFVNPHRIITLLVSHMVEDRGDTGRVVSTITASAMLERMCRRLNLEYVSTPVGFKWIYLEMERGDVMIGGEESGGIGLPWHVKERDGLLMALLLAEMMAQRHMSLGQLLEDMFAKIGKMEFRRDGVTISDEQMTNFRENILKNYTATELCGKKVLGVDRRDGMKFLLENDCWLAMRPSGTEPLVRIYAEAETMDDVEELLAFGKSILH